MSVLLLGLGVTMLAISLLAAVAGVLIGLTWWPSIPIGLGIVWLMTWCLWRFVVGLAAEAGGPAHTIAPMESRTSRTSSGGPAPRASLNLPSALDDPDWL